MKKVFLLIIPLLLTGIFVSAQPLVHEDFSSGNMPPAGWSIDAHTTNWTNENTQIAGGTIPEAQFFYYPDFIGTTRLISAVKNTTGMTSLTLSFRQMLDDYAGTGYSIGVATRSGGGSWNTVWSVSPTGNIPSQLKVLELDNSDVGASDFQFCIYLDGNSYNLDDWYLDDIELSESGSIDAALMKINMPRFSDGIDMQVKGNVLNMGLDSLTSFAVNYQIDSGGVITDQFSGLNLGTGASTDFTFPNLLNLSPGNYTLKMWVSNANGGGPDQRSYNDSLQLDLHIASQSVDRLPLFEEFTSSTSNTCATFNTNVFNPFIQNNGDNLVLVKYQMNWPDEGDPYYTEEDGVRRDYYGVSSVPDLYVDGRQTATTATGVNNAFNNSLASPAFMDIWATHWIDDMTIGVQLRIDSYISADVTAYMVIFENTTTGNASTNGETEFHHVMMKMLPAAEGGDVTLTDGDTTTLSASADMSTTNVEDMDDLGVAVFVQEPTSRMIFQAAYSIQIPVGIREDGNMPSVKIYPTPTRGTLHISGLQQAVDIHVYDMYGREVLTEKGFNSSTMALDGLRAGNYVLRMESKNGIKIQNICLIR